MPKPLGKAQWLILTMDRSFGVFDLSMAVESAGFEFKCVPQLPLGADELVPDDQCVVVNGAAGSVAKLCAARGWDPEGWCQPRTFACQTYYEHWSSHIAQQRLVVRPLGALANQQAELFQNIGDGQRLFIRPDGFDKAFDGGIVGRDGFTSWLRRTLHRVSEETLCIVSRPEPVGDEWRLIVRNRLVIAGSSYRIAGRIVTTQTPPAEVIAFAESVAADPYPGLPAIYVMDIGMVGTRLAVVEVGSINACGFYGCDMAVVIKAISDEAENAWQRRRGLRSIDHAS